MTELLYRPEVHRIIGAAMEVHTALGSGFLEPVYQEALELEFLERGIPFEAQKQLHIMYKQHLLTKLYIPDFFVFDRIIVEIKAISALSSREEAQLLNYLKATRCRLGVLINFGSTGRLEWKRLARTRK
jgi:GxxExxY protein